MVQSTESVSIIIPTYNRAHLIVDSLQSLLKQCRDNDEILVIDDGSTDNTKAAIEQLSNRIRYIHQANAGAGATRNRGIREASHDLIAFLDSDDQWLPNKLLLQSALMQKRPDIVFSFGDFCVKHYDGRITHNYLKHWHQDDRSWDDILGAGVRLSEVLTDNPVVDDPFIHIGDLYADLMAASYVFTSTMMARSSLAGERLFFTEGIKMYEDWACFGRLAALGPVAFIDKELAQQGGHFDGRLTDADAHVRARARIIVLEEVWGADGIFLEQHRKSYQQILDQQRIASVEGLISEGKVTEAREELRKVTNPPLVYRIIVRLPFFVTNMLLKIRRLMRRLV